MERTQDQIDKIKITLPQIRLERYKKSNTDSFDQCIERYLWNLDLCEATYTSLHMYEIALRNNLDNHLTNKYKKANWFDMGWIGDKDKDRITHVENKIRALNKIPTRDRIISELPLGFWTDLFSNYYERELWQKNDPLKSIFPYIPRSEKVIGKISRMVNSIRIFRNRVFHHECIIHMDFNKQHDEILKTIGWMNDEIHKIAIIKSRFNDVSKFEPI